jgi:hypothetical protein
MSALPKAVQKQIEEANRLAEQLNKQRLDGQAPPPPDGTPVPDSGNTPAAAAPDAGQPPADGGQPANSATPAPAAEGWEQKYRVLQGKYNAEVPRLQRQVNEQNSTLEQFKAQLTATQGMLSALANGRVAAPAGQGPAPAAQTKLVKDEEVNEFGADLTDFIKRVAQDALLPAIDQKLQPVQQQVAEVRQSATKVAERSAQSDHERLLATLDQQIKGWRQQNNDPGFLDWLAQPDPFSGLARGSLLRQAYEGFDVPRIVAIFEGYRNEHAVVTPPPAPAAAEAAPQKRLDDFVAPGTPKAGSTGAQDGAGKRIWTQAEIKRFYDDCTAGKFRTTEGQVRRREIEQDIVAAAREGRVR